MNLRSIMLLAAALLMQFGQGLALDGGSHQAEGYKASCSMVCCAWMKECPCAEAPDSAPIPQTPAPLPMSGRDLVSQPVMTAATAFALEALSTRTLDDARCHPIAPRMVAVAVVPLTVLHCAFLI